MDIQGLIDEYAAWLREKITFEKFGEYYEITTPYLDNSNDFSRKKYAILFYRLMKWSSPKTPGSDRIRKNFHFAAADLQVKIHK